MDPLTLDTHLQRNPELVAVDMDGETVMMDVESGHYFGLDAVGSVVWEALAEPVSAQAIASRVRTSFEVAEEDNVEGDMLVFLAELQADGLVRIVSE